MATLSFYAGTDLLFTHALLGPRMLIGRSERCDIALPDTNISRVHCIISIVDTEYQLINRSQFGTFLKGTPTTRVNLKEGDIIEIGDYRLHFSLQNPASQNEQSTAKRPNPLKNSRYKTSGADHVGGPAPLRPKNHRESPPQLVGNAPAMDRLYRDIETMARHRAPVLITGESGTGKELTARALHQASERARGPFVAINCAAIADTLFESELFGHEKGSFSGAISQKDGAFLAADGGTIFLDEVGELRYDLQAKLLRVLETGEVRRVGSTTTHRPNVRIIAATNRSLAQMVAEKEFREDLLYRLSILTLKLPPLRDRLEDIPQLVSAILTRHGSEADLSESAITTLKNHNWPGNVRELRNVILRAIIMHGSPLKGEHFEFTERVGQSTPAPGPALDRETLETALLRNQGNRSQTARELGIPRSTLIYKIKHWEISA